MYHRRPTYEVVIGGLGSGKSTHAMSVVNSRDTFALCAGSRWCEFLNLRFGSIKKHRDEKARLGFQFKESRPSTMAKDIKEIRHNTVLIDEWTTFRHYTIFWTPERIERTIDGIFEAIDSNPHISRVIFVCSECVPYLPFSLYKKTAIWNKRLMRIADRITRMFFGVPTRIHPLSKSVGAELYCIPKLKERAII